MQILRCAIVAGFNRSVGSYPNIQRRTRLPVTVTFDDIASFILRTRENGLFALSNLVGEVFVFGTWPQAAEIGVADTILQRDPFRKFLLITYVNRRFVGVFGIQADIG